MESMTLSTRTPQESQSNRETAQKHEIKAQNLPPFLLFFSDLQAIKKQNTSVCIFQTNPQNWFQIMSYIACRDRDKHYSDLNT